MPQLARQSSIGGRKAPPRAHIPYRADDLGHGKKTGISIDQVDHRSDEFEPFDEVLGQAGNVTPPHVRARKKRKGTPSPRVAGHDEEGELSMELDEDTGKFGSPAAYFENVPRLRTPSSANRFGSATRSGQFPSDVDFDSVPSPRPNPAVARRSNGRQMPLNGSAFTGQTSANSRHWHESSDDVSNNHDLDGGVWGNDLLPARSPSPPNRRSFSQLDQDGDDIQDRELSHSRQILHDKTNGHPLRQRPEPTPEDDDDEGIENEIAQGLQELDANENRDDVEEFGEDEQHISEPAKKKAKVAKKASARRQQVLQHDSATATEPEYDENGNPLRRGARRRYKPLEWWRCEKVVWGRRETGFSVVPVIKDIIRLPKETPEPLGTKKRTRHARRQSKQPQARTSETLVFNPEDGWDANTEPYGVVFDFATKQDIKRRIACTSRMIAPKSAADDQFFFQKVFGEENFMAAGQLLIPVGGKKPSKGSKDNTYVFCLLEGAIKLQVHRSSFVIATGGMFLVPRGNVYYMENIGKRDARLFFAQARKITAAEDAAQPPTLQHHTFRRSAEASSSRAGPSTG